MSRNFKLGIFSLSKRNFYECCGTAFRRKLCHIITLHIYMPTEYLLETVIKEKKLKLSIVIKERIKRYYYFPLRYPQVYIYIIPIIYSPYIFLNSFFITQTCFLLMLLFCLLFVKYLYRILYVTETDSFSWVITNVIKLKMS